MVLQVMYLAITDWPSQLMRRGGEFFMAGSEIRTPKKYETMILSCRRDE